MTEPTSRIEAALSHLGNEHEPPAGWEARVIAATSVPRRKPWWLFATSAIAFVGAGVVVGSLVFSDKPRDEVVAFAVDAPYSRSNEVVRGAESLHVGDVVHATARGGRGYRAVWVYRHDQLVAACPGGPACRFAEDATIADVELRSIGSYQLVALSSRVPLAPPLGIYDTDVANAQKAEAVYLEKQLHVR